ncbi:hypothetical protein BpHYR1_038368 [Brachionus plicatilis]|uniref:Uncharacterized protein n=1 Tax=Brachionus plicatilis TaxID=10195 RepID=A0A3M7R275_BRAPC|nr:hypothetical protein BpHYR1_038368 [Brachionus plicatilis]
MWYSLVLISTRNWSWSCSLERVESLPHWFDSFRVNTLNELFVSMLSMRTSRSLVRLSKILSFRSSLKLFSKNVGIKRSKLADSIFFSSNSKCHVSCQKLSPKNSIVNKNGYKKILVISAETELIKENNIKIKKSNRIHILNI